MKIAIIGFGSVGQGVARAILKKGLPIAISGVADSRSAIIDNDGIDIGALLVAKERTGMCGNMEFSAGDVISQADYDVLVEVSPTDVATGEPALGHMMAAIRRGKHVVTSNKGPIAGSFPELLAEADKYGVTIRYEATVCGAIPLIHALHDGLAGNEISHLYGVLNGTCNYILTRMSDEGLTYDQALMEARELGYAEADPTYDVKGIDAAIKLVILANTIWNMGKMLDDVEITGIDNITPDALKLVEDSDRTIRLIGEIIPVQGILRVSPRMLHKRHPMVVEGTLNAVMIETDMAGKITLAGKGAGSIETASAIIGDILHIMKYHVKGN